MFRKTMIAVAALALAAPFASPSFAQVTVPCYVDQGAALMHLGSGCTLNVESGGAINIVAGGGIKTGTAAAAPTVFHTGQAAALTATQGTDTTPSVTETYIAELYVPVTATLTGVSILNGSAVAGNMQISLADSTGAPIAAALTASTAQSGTAAFQQVPFAAPYVAKGPGKYFVLVQFNNTSARFRSHIVGNFGASKKTGETYGTFTTVTPPTTFTTGQGPVADSY